MRLLLGDCIEQMKTMPDASIDAVCTDPPYGINFMGKAWDGAKIEAEVARRRALGREADGGDFGNAAQSAGIYDVSAKGNRAFQPWTEAWAVEAFRVLKPGGHLLSFASTRTYHRMASGVEDAGFEIRDTLAWMYGSGFPKSLDVSKAIDRGRDDSAAIDEVRAWLDARRTEAGVSLSEINERLGLATNGGGLASSWTANQTTRAVPQWEQWIALKELLGFDDEMDAAVAVLNGRKGEPDVERERKAAQHRQHPSVAIADSGFGQDGWAPWVNDPVKDDARAWQGWGTALKPAFEPIVLARKPLAGTVAENVLAHGTGALNVDGCRIEFAGESDEAESKDKNRHADFGSGARENEVFGKDERTRAEQGNYDPPGRWPANVLLDPEAAAMLDEQTGERGGRDHRVLDAPGERPGGFVNTGHDSGSRLPNGMLYDDRGGASRFFYCAKVSRSERNAGLDGFEERALNWSSGDQNPGSFQSEGTDRSARNHHPTVKPIDLMRWLIRLVTPPGGTVLDPFLGSGSTGCAAALEGVEFVGIEREADYMAVAEARIRFWEEHGEQGLDLVRAREAADRVRAEAADAGQLDLFAQA